MHSESKTTTLLAVIREAECIGCTKCIKACPVDAILGAAKQMHTVITDECTGCELCIAPCPVDCIDMISIEQDEITQEKQIDLHRERYLARQKRLHQEETQQQIKIKKTTPANQTAIEKKAYIEAALKRAKQKKLQSNSHIKSFS